MEGSGPEGSQEAPHLDHRALPRLLRRLEVRLTADGRKVTQQTPLVLRKEDREEEIAFKSEVLAEMTIGAGEDEKKFTAEVPELILDTQQEKQWKQIGSDPTGVRLQVRFVRKSHGAKTGFAVADIRATVPDSPKAIAIGETS